MMKKTLFFGALAAMLLGTASCADENMFGNDGNVCFEIELPGAIESRTISDGEKATALTVAVYDENGAELPQLRQTATLSGKKGTVTFNLVRGKQYSFAFWAQDPNATCYTFTPGTGEVSIDYAGICNDEKRDAFYAYREPQVINGTITETIKLYRPFAQLNYIATDYAEAVAAGYDVNKSSVTVKNAATSFNLKTGKPGAETTEVTFALNNRPAEAPTFMQATEGTTYTWMAMNYFIVPDNEAMIETSLTLNEGTTPVVENMAVNNVPVKKNHRTNIIGAFMTTQAIFNIEVIPFYDEVDYDIINGVLMLKNKMTVDEINYLFKNRSGAYALAEDLTIDNYISIPAGTTATLDLNGHTITNEGNFYGNPDYALIGIDGGNLTIKGNGKVIAKPTGAEDELFAVDIWYGGNLTIEGGEFVGNDHAIYVYEGHATINGGTFSLDRPAQNVANDQYRYTLNLYDANGRNGSASIEVTGGKYYKFDPANNQAEGPGTDFLAPGYETVQNGDWYTVQPVTPVEVSTEEQLDAALKATGKKDIAVKLMNDISYFDIGARTAWGNDVLKSLTIDGNGHRLGFDLKDSDWNSFGTMNNADLILKNITLGVDRTQGGTWNTWAMNIKNYSGIYTDDFTGSDGQESTSSTVTMQNAVCERTISVTQDAAFENVTFKETTEHYTLFIIANVKNVTVKNCSFIASNGGRGIKVADQYVDKAKRQKVNITVSGTTFNTAKKAAVLLSNTAGANIKWQSGNDISMVAKDNVNAVWVDKGNCAHSGESSDFYSNYQDQVTVDGCTFIVEPK